jgi:hypothetical protein
MQPNRDEAKLTLGRSRSEIEQSIFCSLVRQGWSDEHIHAFAARHELCRYVAPARYYVISARSDLDGREADLREALETIVGCA